MCGEFVELVGNRRDQAVNVDPLAMLDHRHLIRVGHMPHMFEPWILPIASKIHNQHLANYILIDFCHPKAITIFVVNVDPLSILEHGHQIRVGHMFEPCILPIKSQNHNQTLANYILIDFSHPKAITISTLCMHQTLQYL